MVEEKPITKEQIEDFNNGFTVRWMQTTIEMIREEYNIPKDVIGFMMQKAKIKVSNELKEHLEKQ